MCEHEATIDICIHINGIRNLGQNYLSKYYFKIAIVAGESHASPYQIIPHRSDTMSSISLIEYISPLFTLAPYAQAVFSELAVFKSLVPLAALEESQLQINVELYELSGQEERHLQTVRLDYTSILRLSCFMPICFSQTKCAVDAVIITHFLACRFRNIHTAPKTLLYSAIEGLLISFNRLRQKLRSKKESYEYEIESFPQMEDIRRFTKTRIFQESQQEQRNKLLQFELKLPRISFCVQQLWTNYLNYELLADIQKYRSSFLKSYALQIRHNVYMRQNANESINIVDGLKLVAYPLSVKTVLRKPAEGAHEYNGDTPHLLFLVHGFGASSKTLQQLELGLRFFYPHLHVVTSKINENRTDDNLQEMGKRLALEVEASLQALQIKDNFSLSFIGHSLGGLIIRASLSSLEKYRFSMRMYISLGTPHLGYLYHNSKLTKFGMWAYNLFKNSPSMGALLMEGQSGNHRLSYLYQLSNTVGFNWFEEVLLYAGFQDYYVSPQSALIEANQLITQEHGKRVENALIWEQMRQNLSEVMQGVGVSKYLVDFEKENMINEGSMADELLGRRNHMNLATSTSFILALILTHSTLL